MWKYNANIPCHNIMVGDIVRVDIEYTSGSSMHGPLKVVEVCGTANCRCLYEYRVVYVLVDGITYSPWWINGNMCLGCVYNRKTYVEV